MTNYWQDAPEWAEWIAFDYDGSAWYYSDCPDFSQDLGVFVEGGLTVRAKQHNNTNKAGQLEKRPEGDL